MKYPVGYEWLGTIGTLPKLITNALSLYGVHEAPGSVNSPAIMAWARATGLDRDGYTADSVPWCGLFMAYVAQLSSYPIPSHPLWALNWQAFGTKALQPVLGCVLVFLRNGGGHVGLYVGEDQSTYHVLGGNTSDAVQIARIDKKRLRAAREPAYRVGRPASARPYILAASGVISQNEA
jgi:uncharacterized protein (TIGR02594 family)